MSKVNQRVIDLNKIDTKEKAFLVGMCVMNTEFPYFKKALEKNELHIVEVRYSEKNCFELVKKLEEVFDAEVIEKTNTKYLDIAKKRYDKFGISYTDDTFLEEHWLKSLKSYNCIIKITEDSKHWFNGKLPTVKKELYPSLLHGILNRNGFFSPERKVLQFIQHGKKNALELLKKQLKNWYNIDSKEIITNEFSGLGINILNIDFENAKKVYQIK